MDNSNRTHSINNSNETIRFNETTSKIDHENYYNGHSAEEFVKYFSIDDDDIIQLDQSETILYDVTCVVNRLIDNIADQSNQQSQMKGCLNKRSLDLNDEQYLFNKKVRFDIPDNTEQQIPTSLFVSEAIDSADHLKPSTKFLYHLGLDLCLKENFNENTDLSEIQKQSLIKQNNVFFRSQVYSCKYCSFKTDTMHVMDHHYRTPHILSNTNNHQQKFRCTYCSMQTFHMKQLRRHYAGKHGHHLATEPPEHRYSCCFCNYETNDRSNFYRHKSRCEIEQERTRNANNLLQPIDLFNENKNNRQIPTFKTKLTEQNRNKQTKKASPPKSTSNRIENFTNINTNNEIIETIIIESDHDSSSLSRSQSDEDFIVSSDEDSSSDEHVSDAHNRNFEISTSRAKSQNSKSNSIISSVSQPHRIQSASNTLPSLSKLLLLNGTSIAPLPVNSVKSSLISIQPKPMVTNNIYQMCNICQCYVYKKDFEIHMKEKHQTAQIQIQPIISTPLTILSTTTNSINTPITCLTPAVITTETLPQLPTAIFLLSTSTTDSQTIKLDMIKCPWCDTNFEHIDIMTGHLMRYHRMTLAAAKVVVAEQMKIQGTSSSQLSLMFKKEIEQIQKEFTDKIYWKISQPKVYLHQVENVSCFVCKKMIDDFENHFISTHQVELVMMNRIKQCCFCGFHSNKKSCGLYEHQLRTHLGVCYSSVLKQFIRFEPPPPPSSSSRIIAAKTKTQSVASSNPSLKRRTLTTVTEKKFGCRKCGTSSRLFTFEELVEHLRLIHKLIVKLQRFCVICQQTFPKGKEYNQHCLEHLNSENPTVKIKRQYVKRK